MGIITEKLARFTVAHCSPEECEFYDTGSHIMVKAVIEGSTFCAFFDKRPYSIESLKNCKLLRLHNIYPSDEITNEDEFMEEEYPEAKEVSKVDEIQKENNALEEDNIQAAEQYSKRIMEALCHELDLDPDDSIDYIRSLYSTREILDAVLNYEGLYGYVEIFFNWIKEIYGIDLEEIGDYIG